MKLSKTFKGEEETHRLRSALYYLWKTEPEEIAEAEEGVGTRFCRENQFCFFPPRGRVHLNSARLMEHVMTAQEATKCSCIFFFFWKSTVERRRFLPLGLRSLSAIMNLQFTVSILFIRPQRLSTSPFICLLCATWHLQGGEGGGRQQDNSIALLTGTWRIVYVEWAREKKPERLSELQIMEPESLCDCKKPKNQKQIGFVLFPPPRQVNTFSGYINWNFWKNASRVNLCFIVSV